MALGRGQNTISAICIFVLIVLFILTYIEDTLLRLLFVIFAFSALLRVLYQILIPREEGSGKEKKGRDREGTTARSSKDVHEGQDIEKDKGSRVWTKGPNG